MALIVQNDDGLVAGANSYIDVDYFNEYHSARGVAVDDFEIEQIEPAIIKATDYIDSNFVYKGSSLNGRDQTTQWPRSGATDAQGYYVEGIPREVKAAAAEYAIRAISSDLLPDPVYDQSGRTVSEKTTVVGPITTTVKYAVSDSINQPQAPSYPAVDSLIDGFTNQSNVIMVTR